MRVRRATSLALLTAALSSVVVGSRPASGVSVVAFSGECVVTLHAQLDTEARRLTFATEEPGTCVTNYGGGTFTVWDAWAAPSASTPGFDCNGGVGIGGVNYSVSTPLMSATSTDALVGAVRTAGSVQLAFGQIDASISIVSQANLVELPNLACGPGVNELTWQGTLTFATPDRGGGTRFFAGLCQAELQLFDHPVHPRVIVSTPEPAACTTNFGNGVLSLDGAVGVTGAGPGLTCVEKALGGQTSLAVTAPRIQIASDTVRLDLVRAGAVLSLSLVEHTDTIKTFGSGIFTPAEGETPCLAGRHSRWTGVITIADVLMA